MIKLKKCTAILLTLSMLAIFLPQAAFCVPGSWDKEKSFTDLEQHWAAKSIEKWAGKGIITGDDNHHFNPDDGITRAEFCAIINRVFGFTAKSSTSFSDVSPEKWYAEQVSIAKNAGYVAGYGNNVFGPEDNITRQDAAKILKSVFELSNLQNKDVLSSFTDAGDISDYAKDAANIMVSWGYIQGTPDKSFEPGSKITRAETIAILDRIVAELFTAQGTVSMQTIQGNVVVNKSGIEIKDTIIDGNLYLAEGIGQGDVVLSNGKVTGKTYVNGGEKGIHISSSHLGEVAVRSKNGKARLVVSGTSEIHSVELLSAAAIELQAGAKIEKLTAGPEAGNTTVSCNGKIGSFIAKADGITVNGISVTKGSTVEVNGTTVSVKDTGTASHNNGNGTATPAPTATPTPTPTDNTGGESDPWTLVWSDEFNDTTIDSAKWTYDLGSGGDNPGWGNNEKELYTSDAKNVKEENGVLKITALKDSGNANYPYTSARIKTKGLFSKKYGKFEIRAKAPGGKGLWPAIWMLPEDSVYGVWAASGEIDIMEGWGSDTSRICGTIHYGQQWPNNKFTGKTYYYPNGGKSTDFHTYSFEWEPGEMRWYVDGVLYSTQNSWFSKGANTAADYTYPAPFDQPFHLIMNLAVGGNFDGDPDSNADYIPATMEVDYVHIYELTGRPYKTLVKPEVSSEPLPDGYQVQDDGNLIYSNNYGNGFIDENDASKVPADTVISKETGKWMFLHLTTGGSDFGGEGSISTESIGGGNFAKIDITSPGNQTYAIQLIKTATLARGRTYKGSFDAKSTGTRNISVKVSGDGDAGWASYSNGDTFPLSDSIQHYEFTFTMNASSDLKARFEFNVGLDTNPVWIGNVRLEEITPLPENENAAKEPLGDGNHVWNGTFDQGDSTGLLRMKYWNFSTSGAAAVASVNEAARQLKAAITEGGADADSVELVQKGIKMLAGNRYKLSFDARASAAGTLQVEIKSKDGLTKYAGPQSIALSSTMEAKEFTFEMPAVTDLEARLVFELGGSSRDIYMDNIMLTRTTMNSKVGSSNIVLNSEFENNSDYWTVFGADWEGVNVTSSVYGAVYNGALGIHIGSYEGNEFWSTQLIQGDFTVEKGKAYRLTFDAKSTKDRTMEAIVESNGGDYTKYLDQILTLTNEMRTYSVDFTAGVTDSKAHLVFALGKIGNAAPIGIHDIYFDNVRLFEIK